MSSPTGPRQNPAEEDWQRHTYPMVKDLPDVRIA